MNAHGRLETKALETDDADADTVERVVKQFGTYHAENKKLFSSMKDRLDDIETKLAEERDANEKLEEKFNRFQYIKGGTDEGPLLEAKAQTLEFMRFGTVDGKALNRSSDPEGGYGVPDALDDRITDQLINISSLRPYARVVKLGGGAGDFKLPIGRRGATSSWVDETQTRAPTAEPSLGMVTPFGGELMSYASATQWLLDDSKFDMEQWLLDNIADEHAFQEGAAFITGSGINRPRGFLSGTPVTTADATRAFGVLKYIFTGVSGDFAASNPGDKLIDLVYDLSAAYRKNAVFLMNSNTAGKIMKFKEATTNAYLWARSIVSGQPDRLLGYNVVIDENMPDIGPNTFSVAFGDFGRGYLIVDKLGSRMVRDPFTQPGWIKFYVFRRVYGGTADSNAIRLLKFGTS